MKKRLFLVFSICLLYSFSSFAQGVWDGFPQDSVTTRFKSGTIPDYIPDTAGSPLWQIGTTYKSFFMNGTTPVKTIMTDTLSNYPVNANNWFVIKFKYSFNTIVDFWHKYQTTNNKDGGIVEFSLNKGITWENIKGPCNDDSSGFSGGATLTENFYTFIDTLATGEPAFTGTPTTVQYSRFQFFVGFPVKPTSGGGCSFWTDSIYVRFRFVSDSVPDTLAGWRIDSVKVEHDNYPGSVKEVQNHALKIFPNPSHGIINFPKLQDEETYMTEVYNYLGERIMYLPYRRTIALPNRLPGVYFYRVSNGTEQYSGQLLIE